MVNQSASTIELVTTQTDKSEIFNKTSENYDLLPLATKIKCFDNVVGRSLSEYDRATRIGGEEKKKFIRFEPQMDVLREIFTTHSIYKLTSDDIGRVNGFFKSYLSKRKADYESGNSNSDTTLEYYEACVGLCYVQTLLNEMDPAQRTARVERKNGNGREELLVEKERPRGNRQHKRNREGIPTVRSFRLTPSDFESD